MLQGVGNSGAHAKALRQSMPPPEIVLWLALRERPGGFKFRRQHPPGSCVADFYCHVARLVIEVDGAAPAFGDRPGRDVRRDANGRAWCRERVRRYVYHWGVTVTLTTKTNKEEKEH